MTGQRWIPVRSLRPSAAPSAVAARTTSPSASSTAALHSRQYAVPSRYERRVDRRVEVAASGLDLVACEVRECAERVVRADELTEPELLGDDDALVEVRVRFVRAAQQGGDRPEHPERGRQPEERSPPCGRSRCTRHLGEAR